MKVQLTSSRVVADGGDFVSQRIGDVLDVSQAEGERMIANRQAKPVEAAAPRDRGTPQEPRTATKPTGRTAAKRTK